MRASDTPNGVAELSVVAILVTLLSLSLSALGLAHALTAANAAIAALTAGIATLLAVTRLPASFSPRSALLWILLVAPFAAIPATFIPALPFTWDEVAYSVALPKLYAARSGIGQTDAVGAYSLFPSNYEAITTATILWFDGIWPMRALGVALFLGLALQAGSWSALVGRGRRIDYVVVAVLILSADVAIFAPMVKNDIFNAFFQGFTLVGIGLFARSGNRSWLLLSAVTLGVSVGTKYTSLQFAACVTLVLVPYLLAVLPRRSAWSSLFLFCLVAGAIASPWYVRNFVAVGNPVSPFLGDLFSAGSPLHAERQAMFRDVFYGLAGFSYAGLRPSALFEVTRKEFGLLPLLLAPVGMIVVLGRASRLSPAERGFAWFLAVLTVIYSAVIYRFGAWAPRYYVVLLALYSLFAAAAITTCLSACARLSLWPQIPAVIVGLLTAGLAVSSAVREWQEYRWTLTRIYSLDRADFVKDVVGYGPVATWINRNLPAAAYVGLGIDVQPSAYIERRYFIIHFLNDIFLDAHTESDYLERFRRMGLTHLAIQDWIGQPHYPEATNPAMYRFIRTFEAAIRALERSGSLRPLGEVDGLLGKKVRFFEIAAAPR